MNNSSEVAIGDNWVKYVNSDGGLFHYCWNDIFRRARTIAANLAKHYPSNDILIVDCPNCVELVSFLLAGAISGRLIALLNPRLSKAEKLVRIQVLVPDVEDCAVFAKSDIVRLAFNKDLKDNLDFSIKTDSLEAFASSFLIDNTENAIVMFTSGTTGTPKAAVATWQQLSRAAMSANLRLNENSCNVVWQLALPLCHIGGMQIIMRSLLCGASLVIHEKFQAGQILDLAKSFNVTHISVVDKMLQDLLSHDNEDVLKLYSVVLLGGAALNPKTIKLCCDRNLNIYASYGMTETCSMIAAEKLKPNHTGGALLLDGYDATIDVDGALCVSGPGVFEGYISTFSKIPEYEKVTINSRSYFKTSDVGVVKNNRIFIKERLQDMFVSGGENVYPSEIRLAVLSCNQVQDAYVIGVPDAKWGHRPVAFVQADKGASLESITLELCSKVSKLNTPEKIFLLKDMPKSTVGKIDSMALRRAYECRLQITRVKIHEISQELRQPFKTAKGEITTRESLIIELVGQSESLGRGVTGLGECVSFSTDWYMDEILPNDKEVIDKYLLPAVVGKEFLTPWDLNDTLLSCKEAAGFPMARAAIENAAWDMYAKNLGLPLWKLLGAQVGEKADGAVPNETESEAGLVIGITSIKEMLDIARNATQQGYTRIKLKVKPKDAVERVKALRNAYPDLIIMLDANQSFSTTESDISQLKEMDRYGIYCIEEPLCEDVYDSSQAGYGKNLHFEKLEQLQKQLEMKICLDESIVTEEDLLLALQYDRLTCYAVKIGKLGGLCSAIKLYKKAKAKNIDLWMAGMYETSISKRMHAAFQKLERIVIPGDLSSTRRYFYDEIAMPEFSITKGRVVLNSKDFETGLGCEINTSFESYTKSH